MFTFCLSFKGRWRSGLVLFVLPLFLSLGCDSDSPTEPGDSGGTVAPTASFSSNPGSGAAELTVQFLDTSTPGSKAITAWAWTFGDGATSALQNPAHTYATPGFYNVGLSVTSSIGSSSATSSLPLAVAPVASFLVSRTSGLAPLTVDFVDTSQSSTPITSWLWDFGDGTTSSQQSPSHSFDVGEWAVSLTVTNSSGSNTKDLARSINAAGDSDQLKAALLEKYAPRVNLAASGLQGGGRYWPSSVEFAFDNTNRVLVGGQYWLQTKVGLPDATSVIPYFHGPADEADLLNVPTYAFWIEDPARPRSWVDLTYFFFYPYNRGKDGFDSVWGNHVGDWEHLTVRLQKTNLEPLSLALSAHSGGSFRSWAQMEKTSSDHPIIYSAWGSNANYSFAGDHVYKHIDVPGWVPFDDFELVDRCSAPGDATPWDTWNAIQMWDFYAQSPLGADPWPDWMSNDFGNEASGAIFRWGNTQRGCSIDYGFDTYEYPECLLTNGPTGPISKSSVWNVDVLD